VQAGFIVRRVLHDPGGGCQQRIVACPETP